MRRSARTVSHTIQGSSTPANTISASVPRIRSSTGVSDRSSRKANSPMQANRNSQLSANSRRIFFNIFSTSQLSATGSVCSSGASGSRQ